MEAHTIKFEGTEYNVDQAKAWEQVIDHCMNLGMQFNGGGKSRTIVDAVCEFITSAMTGRVAMRDVKVIEAIYCRSLDGSDHSWTILTDDFGLAFKSLPAAIAWVRTSGYGKKFPTGLATYQQMILDNDEWDNL